MQKIIEGLNILLNKNIKELNVENIYFLPLEFILSFENFDSFPVLIVDCNGINKIDFYIAKREKRFVSVNIYLFFTNKSGLNNNYYFLMLTTIDNLINILKNNIQYDNYWTRILDLSIEKMEFKNNYNISGFKLSVNFERSL